MKRASKERGLRIRRRSKATNTIVSLWDGDEIGVGTAEHRWITVCEDHDEAAGHHTLQDARDMLSSCCWCTKCALKRHRACCDSCGESMRWDDHELAPEERCVGWDVLFVRRTKGGRQVVGCQVGSELLCERCGKEAVAKRCASCGEHHSHTSPLDMMRVSGVYSEHGAIEMYDLTQAPEPTPGSPGAEIKERVLSRERDPN